MSEQEKYEFDYVNKHSQDMKALLKALSLNNILEDINDVMPGSDMDMDSERADRYNQGKMAWELIDFESLEPMVEVLMFGAEKYAPNNWKKGQPTSELLGSAMRHIVAYQAGEDIDPDSGKPHLGHIMCNMMFLVFNNRYRQDLDDRN